MNENPDITYKECANGCKEKGTNKPLLARHGNFCNRDYRAAVAALRIAPELVAHMVSLKPFPSTATERVDTSREAPAPGNEQAMNDSHETYRRLIYWAALWSNRMGVTAPGPAIGAWRDQVGHIVGFPENVSPKGAGFVTKIVTDWLELHLESILYLAVDDVQFFLTDLHDVFRLDARWPRKAKPRYSDMPCPRQGCGGRIAVFPPEAPGDDERIVCEKCHTWYPPEEYEHLILVFQQIRKEQRSAAKVAAHLLRKHG